MNADGSYNLFAELEKVSEKQRERIDEAKEKRAEEKKAAEEKRAEERAEAKRKGDHKRPDEDRFEDRYEIKSTRLQASSVEELKELIAGINWDEIEAK